ncbi:MAG: PVC-type heme-binding CxxCH protein, partial [Pirellulales bacterium]
APYIRPSLDTIVARINEQLKFQKERKFPRQADVIAYFNRALDILHKIRSHRGAPADATPAEAYGQDPVLTDSGARTHTSEQLQAYLQPVPPKPIEEVLNSFETVAGMQMQLIAREPLVLDPVAATFAEQGDLYVCEMRDYPYKPQDGEKPLGTVRLLQDHDGDGVFDESHLFASALLWPTGIVAWNGGVFVAAAPDIWYLKDTTGDHQADVRRKVFTGFGLNNQQAMVNNLTWGLDHKIYGSTAGNGGTIYRIGKRKPGTTDGADHSSAVSVDGRDFRFDPVSEQLESITGTIQFGTTFDDWGNRFLCSQAQPALHVVLPQHYLARNPHLPVPKAIEDIAPGANPVFRISPIEHWRQIRSSRRIAHTRLSSSGAGVSQHVVDAAAGVTVYRGGAYGQEFYGNVVVGDAQNNLVHRRRLHPMGVTFHSERADAQTEFVRSSDNWFRPVNFVNGPDGTLTVLDMSREIIESIHIPLDVVKHLDLTSGRDQGRIYRLAPANFQYPGRPHLDKMYTTDLVATLERTASWWRDTAHRLIYERQDLRAVAPLRRLLRKSLRPQTRLHALWSLDGLQALTDEDLEQALGDTHPSIREQALRLAEPRLNTVPALLDRAVELAAATEPRVRLQAAFTLGESNSAQAASALSHLAIVDAADPWIRTAILSSASPFADRLLIDCLAHSSFTLTVENNRLLEQLATVVGGRNRQPEIDRTVEALARFSANQPQTGLSTQLVLALGDGLKRAGARLGSSDSMSRAATQFLEQLFHQVQQLAFDDSAPLAQRQQAIRVLGCAPWDPVGKRLQRLLNIRQPEPIQLTAIRTMSDYASPQIGLLLLENWNSHSPLAREQIIDCLLERPERTRHFLQAVQQGQAAIAQLNTTRRGQLLQHGDATIRTLAQQLLTDAAGDDETGERSDILARYLSALEAAGDATQGEQIFQKNCLPCHRIGTQGHAVGPDLTANASRDAAALLANVLEPNRNVLPSYEAYTLLDTNGRTYSGILSAQTATSITLKREENKTDTILRTNIEELTASGRSLMPEGFEKQINPAAMANLIAYLQSAHHHSAQGEPALDIGTLPGLVEPE